MKSSSSSDAPTVPPRLWIVLRRVGLVQYDADEDLIPSLKVAKPPHFSSLTTPTKAPRPSDDGAEHPYVVAANDAGLLLYVSRTTSVRFDLDPNPRGMLFVLALAQARDLLPADTATGRGASACTTITVRVPDRVRPEQSRISTIKSVGLLPIPGTGGSDYVVAELLVADRASLLTFRSGMDSWDERELTCPLVSGTCPRWTPHDVISHDGNLWWVDLRQGLLCCDPIAYNPVLHYVELPEMFALEFRSEKEEQIDSYRIVRVSNGRLRFVDVALARESISTPRETLVVVWTLAFVPSIGKASWEDHEFVMTTLAKIWEDDSYRRTGMPQEVPVLALVHPHNPDVVYFFLQGYLFSVDVRHSAVVEFAREPYSDLVQVIDRPVIDWRYVLAWVLPPVASQCLNARQPGQGCGSCRSMPITRAIF
ncbi:uncharacterized protein LOC133921998 isoform X2 [Phragmites australis]|uniref:uncharacterized protein LOC133921998 isoform X2 n=1 Tax=Phragmites australis TaxID=29695 RepID=UPI002D78FC06|nr:uncharacterized protein LOC133921998 isoform X2 [Phragmites australis]